MFHYFQNHPPPPHHHPQGRRRLTAVAFLFNLLCGGCLLQLVVANGPPPQHHSQPPSHGGRTSSDQLNSANSVNSNHQHNYQHSSNVNSNSAPSGAPQSSAYSEDHSPNPTNGRAVTMRQTSDISTTNLGDSDSVPTHYDACPNQEPWCSSLDENEKLALEAIHALHHQLDDDKNGNIDLFESNEFLREELKYERDYEKRQENFHRNNDNQISVKELWEIWVKSEVHNWTVDQTAEWIGVFVGLPNQQDKFIQLEINGTYLPRLAVNHHNFLTTNLGIKDVITRQKLTLKAQDVVLFGPPRDNTNHTKDAILTTLLVVAVTVCYLVYCRYKSSQRDLTRMSKDMEALMKAEQTLQDLQKELELAKGDQVKDKEAVTHRASSDDEDELHKLREEVVVLRNELQRAEVELQDKCWVPPPALTHWLQLTYELESKAHNKKRQSAEKQLKQAKEACDKLKKKRSSLMGAFVATHARSIDDVDKAILEARQALTEVTQELQERMHRWKQIEMLVKSPIVNNPGLASLEILLRTGARSAPYLGTGSVMSNSQDDIDDDGASSIYCPSAIHKLVSNSAFMMFPGQNPTPISTQMSSARSYQNQNSSSDYSSLTNYGGDSSRPSQSPEISGKERVNGNGNANNHTSQSYHTDNNSHYSTDYFTDCTEVSGPISNVHAPIVRSKSVQSMLSLRERGYNRESSSKDSSNGEEDILGDPSEMSAKDRRVTFRAAAADRRSGQLRSLQGRGNGPMYEPMEYEETRNYYSRKPLSSASRLDSSKSSEEEHERKKQSKEEPDLIKVPINTSKHVDSNNAQPVENQETGGGGNKLLESDFHQSQAPEQNNILLLKLNNNTTEPFSNNIPTPEESSPSQQPPPKVSLFKTISKLMHFPSDGLNSKKTKKLSKDNSQQEQQQQQPQHDDKQFGNGNIASSKNNLFIEKNLLPNYNQEGDKDPNQNSDPNPAKKSQKKSAKFFSLPRRAKPHNSTEVITT